MKNISSTAFQEIITYREDVLTEKKIGSSFFRGKKGV